MVNLPICEHCELPIIVCNARYSIMKAFSLVPDKKTADEWAAYFKTIIEEANQSD